MYILMTPSDNLHNTYIYDKYLLVQKLVCLKTFTQFDVFTIEHS